MVDTNWEIEEYRNRSEPEAHWHLKRDFMQSIKHMFDEERVACLAQVLGNMEFMGCQYPHDVMIQVNELAKDVLENHRNMNKGGLRRTLVSGSTAANSKVNKTNTSYKRSADEPAPNSTPAKQIKYMNFVSASSEEPEKKETEGGFKEGFILPPLKNSGNSSNQMTGSSISNFIQGLRREGEKDKDVIVLDDDDEKDDDVQDDYPPDRRRTFKSQYSERIDIQRLLPFAYDFPVHKFILVTLDYVEDENSYCVLQRSACFSKMNIQLNYQNSNNSFEVRIQNFTVCVEYSSKESEARKIACDTALQILSDNCYTVQLKNKFTSNGTEVDIIDVEDNTKVGGKSGAISGSNIGHKMLAMMGWSGGGLGQDGTGRSEPITAEYVFGRQGMGFKEFGGNLGKVFKMKIEKIIKEYIGTPGFHDLVFTTGFDNPQRAEMHKVAKRYGLKSKSFGKGEDRHLTIRKKIDPAEENKQKKAVKKRSNEQQNDTKDGVNNDQGGENQHCISIFPVEFDNWNGHGASNFIASLIKLRKTMEDTGSIQIFTQKENKDTIFEENGSKQTFTKKKNKHTIFEENGSKTFAQKENKHTIFGDSDEEDGNETRDKELSNTSDLINTDDQTRDEEQNEASGDSEEYDPMNDDETSNEQNIAEDGANNDSVNLIKSSLVDVNCVGSRKTSAVRNQ